MGIKDINKVLKEIAPAAFMDIPMSKFRGKAIGIDASLWLFKTKSSAMKDVLRSTKDPLKALDSVALIESIIKQFYGFTYKFCQFGITPVWIFDGKTHPAKIATDKRKKVRSVKRITVEEERVRLEALDPLERVAEIDKFIRGVLGCVSFTKAEETALKEEIASLGLPMFEAPNDAEIFAAAMSRKQLLLGVWTTDTDTYACGALSTMTGFAEGYSKEGTKVSLVITPVILDTLGITQAQFRDFCILHECDFNQRIPKMGPVSIKKKMNENDWDLDAIIQAEPDLPWDLVNIEECRVIFDGPDVSGITIEDLRIDRVKWSTKMKTKVFEMDLPENPTEVEIF
jgi:flap endonuclease-1